MPRLTLRPGGVTLSNVRSGRPPDTVRGDIVGWSPKASQRNRLFLQSVFFPVPPTLGLALTLTLRDCPTFFSEWAQLRKKYVQRLEYHGFDMLHHVTEWATRNRHTRLQTSVPHLHIACFTYQPVHKIRMFLFDPVLFWLDLAEPYGAHISAQHVAVIDKWDGWAEYVAKHASRGAKHYQRDAELPKGWLKTGQMWGHRGDWSTSSDAYQIEEHAFYHLRRVGLRLEISRAKQKVRETASLIGTALEHRHRQRQARVRYLRAYLRKPKEVSSRLPLSEWGLTASLVKLLNDRMKTHVAEPVYNLVSGLV